jgi:aryl-alcohol dehydrogenase-like predicted oxidoreductase
VAQRVLREPHHLLGENPNRGVEAHNRRRAHERAWNVLGAVEVIARSRGMSMAQLARTWLVDRPTVCAVILGARTQAQLDDNMARPARTSPTRI